MHVIREMWYYISDVMEECTHVCNQYKTTDLLNTKTEVIIAAIRGNEGTDFCLVIVAQCLVCWFAGHKTWVRLRMEVCLSHSLLIILLQTSTFLGYSH